MLYSSFLFASSGILRTALAGSNFDLVNAVEVPALKSDFAKNNVTAKWAPGYPKEWGSEDYSKQFNEPEPEDFFKAIVTSDEKYLVMLNGSHVNFVDLDTNSSTITFGFKMADKMIADNLQIWNVPGGGYDVLVDRIQRRYATPATSVRQRVTADLKLSGKQTTFDGGFGTISSQGKYATLTGYVYDLNVENSTVILDGQPEVTDLNFSPNGDQLATVNWITYAVDLWNTATGKRIVNFPTQGNQPWVARYSPDGKYVAVCHGSQTNTILIYPTDNSTFTELKGFNYWPRQVQWSPDGKYLAVGDQGRVQIWKFPELELVQKWELDVAKGATVYEVYDFVWIDGGKKFSFLYRSARYIYDFEENVKWMVTPGVLDHLWGGEQAFFLKKRGLLATSDGDSIVRFWKV